MNARDVVVTGVGLVTCLGEGFEAHAAAFANGPVVNSERFAPYPVHPARALEYDRQIPKKLDQKQMEPWQRLGTYAAGLALEMAGLKGDKDRLSSMQMIVAAGGGERDYAVDGLILTELPKAANPGVHLNERLMGELRPTLFLAQLSNLLAGNISIVHGVTGASRTFMGEESAGVDALRIAVERIKAGQGDAFLVGGSYNAERPDCLLAYVMGDYLRKDPVVPVWNRADQPGMVLGSGGAFLVLEAREVAEARGAKPLAMLSSVQSGRSRRAPGVVKKAVSDALGKVKVMLDGKKIAVISGATGVAGITGEEREAIADVLPTAPVRATGNHFGHLMEGQFPAGVALAVMALQSGLHAAAPGANGEAAAGAVDTVVVTGVGHCRGEGFAIVTKAG